MQVTLAEVHKRTAKRSELCEDTVIGLYVSLIFDLNVAPSVTSTGRSLISSAILCFEGFLGNNVKFSSLNDILTFIDNVRLEQCDWKYNDFDILGHDGFADINETFNKLIMNCGYKYIPTSDDMDIVYKILQNCNQFELNRLFYKNNLYCFMDLPIARNLMINIITKMDRPYVSPMDPPKVIIPYLDELKGYLLEYVFYNHMYIDRMDRNKNMIKTVSLISDTDSSFVSLDAWVRYNTEYLKNYDFPILHQRLDVYKYLENTLGHDWLDETPEWFNIDGNKEFAIKDFKLDEWGDPIDTSVLDAIIYEDPELDYDFYNEKVIENQRMVDPLITIPQDNLKFALVNVMCYILTDVINEYMIEFTKQSGSYRGREKCRINMKNEFFMSRVMLTDVKKHYASLQLLQEGNYLDGGYLDCKGIDCLVKSSVSKFTQKKLRKILLEDILTGEVDQIKLIKDIAIVEREIYTDIQSGSKKFYKPVTVKSISNYETPLRIQGIKSSIVWNYVKGKDLPSLDLNERNSIDVAKVKVNVNTLKIIQYKYPEQYERFMDLVDLSRNKIVEGVTTKELFNGKIDAIAIPKDIEVPEWIRDLIDYESIINDNISGFPVSSAGISKMDSKNINYSNIIKL